MLKIVTVSRADILGNTLDSVGSHFAAGQRSMLSSSSRYQVGAGLGHR